MDDHQDQDRREQVLRLALEQRNPLWAYCLALCRNPIQAEDLFQDAHVTICRKWQDWQDGTPFLAWALTIVRFTFLAGLDDRHQRLVLVETEVLAEAVAEAHAEQEHPDSMRLAALRDCLARLAGRTRQVVNLRYHEGLSCEDVAQRMTMGLPAVYQLLSRARKALAACIETKLESA